MESALIATKLRIPLQPERAAPRERLTDALEREVPRHKLTVISAPAGYGKTTLLAQWAHASRFRVAWLSIDDDDNDIERFLRSLLMAWERVQPGVRDSPLGLLLGAMAPERDAVLAAFVNAADEAPDHTVFVLDDAHLLVDPAIHAALTNLLDHLPPTLHVVLAGRAAPPLPLARYRARDEMLEVRAEDLRFWPDETAAFLNRLMGLDLPGDAVAALHAQTEGWIAGIQLVALTLRQGLTGADRLVVRGSHRFIADYLNEDVLAPLAAGMRQFLLRTSILDRLCGSLCDTVIEQTDSQSMLERLERENLFLAPLDDGREWFRYHGLFADFLRTELRRRHPDDVADLHRRAARWHLAHDLPDQAFDHAVAGDDPELVLRVFERYANEKLNSGELAVAARWLDSLPATWYSTHPLLGLFRAGLLAFTGAFEACLRCIDDVEQRLTIAETDDVRWQLALVTAFRCFIACIHNDLARAERYADQALRDLRDESRSFRASIYHALGDTYRRNGRWADAKACYLQVLSVVDAPGFRAQAAVQWVHVFGALADLELRQGRLRAAADFWRKAIAAIEKPVSWGRLELPLIGWVYLRMGEVLYEWNVLAETGDQLARGQERAELGGDVRARIAGCLLAGRLKLTQGDTAAAAEWLERARPLVEQAPFPDWIGRFERLQLECWLAQGRLRAAVDWADQMLQGAAVEERPDREVAQLAAVRVLIVKGDVPSVERALALLDRLLQEAEAEGRTGFQLEALAQQALAHWRRGDRTGALTALERALRLAEPEGYVRLFADLGLPMARLLQEVHARDVMPDYVATLLAAFAGGLPIAAAAGRALPEPLSPRERETLRLLAAGLTNREIAAALAISPETVKKHTVSVYGKLGVGNRTEAAARARELDLLD